VVDIGVSIKDVSRPSHGVTFTPLCSATSAKLFFSALLNEVKRLPRTCNKKSPSHVMPRFVTILNFLRVDPLHCLPLD